MTDDDPDGLGDGTCIPAWNTAQVCHFTPSRWTARPDREGT